MRWTSPDRKTKTTKKIIGWIACRLGGVRNDTVKSLQENDTIQKKLTNQNDAVSNNNNKKKKQTSGIAELSSGRQPPPPLSHHHHLRKRNGEGSLWLEISSHTGSFHVHLHPGLNLNLNLNLNPSGSHDFVNSNLFLSTRWGFSRRNHSLQIASVQLYVVYI